MSRAAKPRRLALEVIEFGKAVAVQLLGVAAFAADQEEAAMRLARMTATDEGVHALDAVDEPVLDQEIEGAVDGGRRRAQVLVAQLVEQRVGADRLVARPHEFEHAPAQRRESQVLAGA